ncbi:MAG: hypothetical protein QM771_10015 [Nitrospira sp.]
MNPAAVEFTKVTQDEAIGMNVTALMGFRDDDATPQGNNPANQAMTEMRLVTIDETDGDVQARRAAVHSRECCPGRR